MTFDLYRLPEELEELRSVTRAVADKHIAPHAAEADEKSEFPQAAYDALVKADLHALHVPEEFGGAGMGYLEHVVAMEEILSEL